MYDSHHRMYCADFDATFVNHLKVITNFVKYILGIPQYNDIFGYFTAISLYREFPYNDSSI